MKTKVLFSTFLVFILFFSTHEVWAQWVQEEGPYGSWVSYIESNDTYCFAKVSGAIYRSSNEGNSWEKLMVGPYQNGNAFTLNENRIGVTTYNNWQTELFLSEDNGDSWQQIPLLDSLQIIYNIALTDYGIYLANNNDIWVTHNMGETWEYAVINDEVPYVLDMQVFNQKVYFGGLNKITYIEENGVDWGTIDLSIAEQVIFSIFVDGDIMLAEGGQYDKLYRSTDAGSTWEEIEGEWTTFRKKFVKIGADYYIFKFPDLYKSENQGVDWAIITEFSHNANITCFGKSGTKILYGTAAKGVYKSDDLGLNWHLSNVGMKNVSVSNIKQLGNTKLAIAHSGLFKKEATSTAWDTTDFFFLPYGILDMDVMDDKLYVTTSSYNDIELVLKSVNLGNTWEDISPQDLFFPEINQIEAVDGSLYVWKQLDGTVYNFLKSNDEGLNWILLDDIIYQQLGITPSSISFDDGVIYIVNYGSKKMAKSLNQGETWAFFGEDVSFNENQYFNKIHVENGVIFANLHVGYTVDHLYISHDYGESFFSASVNFPIYTGTLPFFGWVTGLDENMFLMGINRIDDSHQHIYITYDKGINWTPFSEGLEKYSRPTCVFIDDTSIWVGTSKKGIWKRAIADIEGIEFFNGHVFADDNNNGIKDIGEEGYPNVLLSQNENRYTTTNSEGDYIFYIWNGAGDTLKATKPVRYAQMIPEFHVLDAIDSSYTFGVYVLPGIKDLQITITPVTAPRPGFNHKYLITYKNVGTVTLDGQVSFQFDNILNYLAASPLPDEVNEPNLLWNFLALLPEESRDITLDFNIPSSTSIGTILSTLAQITPIGEDEQTGDNSHPIREEVVGSFDPNDKSVEPKDEFTTDQLASGEKLVYTIRFQNTGNFPAEFVRITDQLQSTLDVTTFNVLSASHPYTYSIKGTGLVEFFFDNIQLPDSTSNELESHGFIKFAIAAKEYLPLGFTIENFADIYFDYNTPIRTNTAETTITMPTFIRELIETPAPIKVFPTPSKGFVTLAFEESIHGKMDFFIVDNTGKRVKKGEIKPSTNTQLDLSALPTGLYYVLIHAKDKNYIGKILIQ